MGFTATAIAIAGAATAGATVYAANRQEAAAEKAANAQRDIGIAQIEAPLKAEQAAAETAKAKLKLLQAKKTQTILNAGGGLDENNVNKKTILGVGV